MANVKKKKGVIGILTGGGDVPGLNPAIRAVTIRALREGYQVIGVRRGWGGAIDIIRDKKADNSNSFQVLTEEVVNKAGRTGGTFLHTSRTRPSHVPKNGVPEHLKDEYQDETNDLTAQVLKNLDFLGIDYLIPIGGDDTLSYAVRLYQEGVKVVAIPKTMDNDVPGTDYCIGFSTCVTRTIEITNSLRTTAGSHERFLVMEVFGRYAGFTAMLPTMAGAANRCVIPEYTFKMERLAELLTYDRNRNPSKYSIVIVSEGAAFEGSEMIFQDRTTDAYGHAKLGGIGDLVSAKLKEISPRYNNGNPINVINQRQSSGCREILQYRPLAPTLQKVHATTPLYHDQPRLIDPASVIPAPALSPPLSRGPGFLSAVHLGFGGTRCGMHRFFASSEVYGIIRA